MGKLGFKQFFFFGGLGIPFLAQAQTGYIAKLDLDWRYNTSFYNPRFGRYAPELVSDDWSVIGLNSMYSAATSSTRAVRWTRATGVQDLGTFGDQGSGMGSMSTDGSIFYGGSDMPGASVPTAFRWTSATGMVGYTQPWGGTLYNSDRSVITGVDRNGGLANIFYRYDGTNLIHSSTLPGGNQISTTMLAGNQTAAFGQYQVGAVTKAIAWDGIANSALTDMGTLGGSMSVVSYANNDGTEAFGSSQRADFSYQAFRWTKSGGMQMLTPNSYLETSLSYQSTDKSFLYGVMQTTSGANRNFRWTESGGFQDLGSLGGGGMSLDKVSADGSTIVGISSLTSFGKPLAAKWTAATGVVNIGFTNMNAITFAGGSDDLSVLMYATTNTSGLKQLYRVTGNYTFTDMGQKDGSVLSVFDISSDGNKMLLTSNLKMYYWNQASGFQDMGKVDGVQIDANVGHFVRSNKFDLVSGTVRVNNTDQAWIWSAYFGAQDLKQLLITNGADMTGWDSLNEVDLIEDVNGVAYATGLGTYKGVNGFKFFVAVPEPGSFVALGLGAVCLLRRRKNVKS